MRKKPLDISLPAQLQVPKGRKRLMGLIAVFLLLALLASVIWLFILQPTEPQPKGSVQLFLEGTQPFPEGAQVRVRAFSSCGTLELLMDGDKVAEGQGRADAILYPSEGTHTLEAKSGECSDAVTFSVVRKECEEGAKQPCEEAGCPGEKECIGGFFTSCSLQRKICVPGEKVGCPLDSCRFGRMACNQCGNGFSECLPDEPAPSTVNSLICPG